MVKKQHVPQAKDIIEALSTRRLYQSMDVYRLQTYMRLELSITISKEQMAAFWIAAQEHGLGKYVHAVYPKHTQFKFKSPFIPEKIITELKEVFDLKSSYASAAKPSPLPKDERRVFFRWGNEMASLRSDTPSVNDIAQLQQLLTLLAKTL